MRLLERGDTRSHIAKCPVLEVPVEQPALPVWLRAFGPLEFRVDVSIRHYDVFPPVVIEVQELHAPTDDVCVDAKSAIVCRVLKKPVADVPVKGRCLVHEVCAHEV